QSQALKIFVCNVATQHGETDGFSAAYHLVALERHAGRGLVDAVIVNNNIARSLPEAWQSQAVEIAHNGDSQALQGVRVCEADVVAEENRYRHDPQKLAATILRLYYGRDASVSQPQRSSEEAALASTR